MFRSDQGTGHVHPAWTQSHVDADPDGDWCGNGSLGTVKATTSRVAGNLRSLEGEVPTVIVGTDRPDGAGGSAVPVTVKLGRESTGQEILDSTANFQLSRQMTALPPNAGPYEVLGGVASLLDGTQASEPTSMTNRWAMTGPEGRSGDVALTLGARPPAAAGFGVVMSLVFEAEIDRTGC